VSGEALAKLSTFSWPGNVRQLENEVRRAMVFADETLTATSLSPEVQQGRTHSSGSGSGSAEHATLRERVDELERTLVQNALKSTRGNQSRAAEQLGLSRFGLNKMIKRLGIENPSISFKIAREED
jgi:serine/threonine-protein kinase PknK